VSGCGEWKKPTKRNPLYKGKWKAPYIDNPAYKGVWHPRQIPNPDYFEDLHPSKLTPIGAIGFELWTLQDGILFDNIYIGKSEKEASHLAETLWRPKYDSEVAEGVKDTPKSGWKDLLQDLFVALGEFTNALVKDPLKAVTEKPNIALIVLGFPVVIFVILIAAFTMVRFFLSFFFSHFLLRVSKNLWVSCNCILGR